MSPVAGAVEDRVDDGGLARWLGVDQLRAVALQGGAFDGGLVADVEEEAGAFGDAEVDAEVVEDAAGVGGQAGDVGLGQFGPEAGVFDELGSGDVVGMGVFPVGGEEKAGADFAEDRGEGAAVFEGRFEAAVGQAEVVAPGVAEGGVGGGGFAGAGLAAAQGGRLAVGQVEDADVPALLDQAGDGAAGAEFGVVGVGSDDEGVEHGGRVGWRGEAEGLGLEVGEVESAVAVEAEEAVVGVGDTVAEGCARQGTEGVLESGVVEVGGDWELAGAVGDGGCGVGGELAEGGDEGFDGDDLSADVECLGALEGSLQRAEEGGGDVGGVLEILEAAVADVVGEAGGGGLDGFGWFAGDAEVAADAVDGPGA